MRENADPGIRSRAITDGVPKLGIPLILNTFLTLFRSFENDDRKVIQNMETDDTMIPGQIMGEIPDRRREERAIGMYTIENIMDELNILDLITLF